MLRARFLMILCMGASLAQTRIDLSTQAKTVDFSASSWTRPFKTGTSLPSLCNTGDAFFRSDAAPGANLYFCTGSNVWSQATGIVASGSFIPGNGLISTQTAQGQTISTDVSMIPNWYTQSGAPIGLCVDGRDLDIDVSTGDLYICAGGQWKKPRIETTLQLPAGTCFNGVPSPQAWGTLAGDSVSLACTGWVPTLDFAFASDNSVPARAHTAATLPSAWTGQIDFTVRFASTQTGTVKFNLDKACAPAGVAPGQIPAFGNVEAITYTVTDANAHSAGISGLTLPPCNPGDMLFLRLQRDNTAAGNATSAIRFLGASLVVRHQ